MQGVHVFCLENLSTFSERYSISPLAGFFPAVLNLGTPETMDSYKQNEIFPSHQTHPIQAGTSEGLWGLHHTYKSSFVRQPFTPLVLLAFPPLPGTFIPCYVYKKSKDNVHSDHGHNCSIKVAVSVGHSKDTWKTTKRQKRWKLTYVYNQGG